MPNAVTTDTRDDQAAVRHGLVEARVDVDLHEASLEPEPEERERQQVHAARPHEDDLLVAGPLHGETG